MALILPTIDAVADPAGSRAPWDRQPVPWWSHTLAVRLYLFAVLLIPVQVNSGSLEGIIDTRLSPTDGILALAVVLAPASIRIVRQPIAYVPLGLPLILSYGLIIALVVRGEVTSHAVFVKALGAMVLVVLGIVTMAFVRAGFGPRILRVYLLGVVGSAVVGYIDWKFFDLLSFVGHRNQARFVALVADPNNAGALYGAALMISGRYGAKLFKTRAGWVLSTGIIAFALSQTLSRGAFLGVAAGVLALLCVERISAEKWSKLIVAGIMLAGVIVASGFANDAVGDWSRRPDNVGGRERLVEEAMSLWVDSNGLGVGLGSVRAEVGEIVHNSGVWLLAEMSFPGLIYGLVVLGVPTLACFRLRRHDPDLAMALLGAHVVMSVASAGIEGLYQRGWWIIMGCMALPAAAESLGHARRSARQ